MLYILQPKEYLPSNSSHIVRLAGMSNRKVVAQCDTFLREELEVGYHVIVSRWTYLEAMILTICSSHIIVRILEPYRDISIERLPLHIAGWATGERCGLSSIYIGRVGSCGIYLIGRSECEW